MGKPNFFIIGAAKAGTTALYALLSEHPDVFMCPIKEPHHFASEINPEHLRPIIRKRYAQTNITRYIDQGMPYPLHSLLVKDRKEYEDLFRFSGEAIAVGEASPSYLHSPMAAAQIHAYNPQARIVVILREPVSRLQSHYLMERRMGMTTEPLTNAILHDREIKHRTWGSAALYTELGCYSDDLKRYMDIFPPEQILVLWYEQLVEDPAAVVRELCAFLKIRKHVPALSGKRHNASELPRSAFTRILWRLEGIKDFLRKSIRSRKIRRLIRNILFRKADQGDAMPIELKKQLGAYYSDDIRRLATLTGRNLDHWIAAVAEDSVS
ncbi:MAG: sulfotransferase family protein [Bacteroidota bacterium]|jgi:hypothetical protein